MDNQEYTHFEEQQADENPFVDSPFDVENEEPNHIFDQDEPTGETENYDEVLQLTEFSDGMLQTNNNSYGVIAEYNDVSFVDVEKKYLIQSKNFVGKITKFILEFDDVELNDKHKRYLGEVGKLQMSNLQDMLVLVDMNKQMLANVLNRVNATQAEDYAIIETYNKLLNQQLKLMKELQATYKAIPSSIKKMRNDILLSENGTEQQATQQEIVVTEDFGDSHFNNGKQLLRRLREKMEQDNLQKISGMPSFVTETNIPLS